jgi:hypothetical protein
MRAVAQIADSEEEKARARLLAYFEDNPKSVFYSRQLEVLFEREYFHWITNRALRRLVEEGRVHTEVRKLSTGSEMKLVWHRSYRFYKRSADDVFRLVDQYTRSATDGTLGMQGEHLVLAAFARQRFILMAEEANRYGDREWQATKHNLDLIFERDGRAYGIEVKNTLGYLDVSEFVTKIRLARHIGVVPVFAVRALPKTWISALYKIGGYAMIMRFQFYPWTHKEIADRIRDELGLPVDTPKKIEQGTMQRFENWIVTSQQEAVDDPQKVDRLLAKIEEPYLRRQGPEEGELGESEIEFT